MKQPLLIPEKQCLLFQTKIEYTNCKNSKTEFKVFKNPIFDTTQYDLLKWSITEKYVLGYKLKEGACIVFSKDPNDVKDHKYQIKDDRGATLNSSWGGFYSKSKEQMINSKIDIVGGFGDHNNSIPKEELFRLYKERIDVNSGADLRYGGGEFYDRGDSSEQWMPEDELEQSMAYQMYLDSLRKGVQPGFMSDLRFERPPGLKTSNQQTGSTEPSLNTFSSNPRPFGGLFGPRGMRPPPQFIDPNAHANSTSSTSSNPFYPSYPPIDNSLNPSTGPNAFWNFSELAQSQTTSSNAPSLVPASSTKKSSKRDKMFEPYADYKKEELRQKIQNKKEKGFERKIETISSSHNNNIKTAKFTREKSEPAEKIIQKQPEVVEVIEDNVRGTFIKVIHAIQMNKSDNTFCYDPENKIYYILANISLVSVSILVSNTFSMNHDLLNSITENSTKSSFNDVLNFFGNFSESATLETFTEKLIELLMLLQSRKVDGFWKYSNWNYYYNSLLEHLSHVSFNLKLARKG